MLIKGRAKLTGWVRRARIYGKYGEMATMDFAAFDGIPFGDMVLSTVSKAKEVLLRDEL